VGIAVSDEAGEFAFPKAVVETSKAFEFIIDICQADGIGGIIIGESVASNGETNDLMKVMNTFKAKLAVATNLPIFFEREDYSSVEAHRYQTAAGSRDDSAAAIILQRYLDKHPGQKEYKV
jgi:RNase H-fold protein (predicted Holliday junction resolvase)